MQLLFHVELPANHFAGRVIVEVMMAKDPVGRTNWVNALKNCINGNILNKVIIIII